MATDLVTQIKGEIEQLVAENAELQAQVDELERELRKFKDMNNDAGEEIAELQSKLDELERENAKLSERKCPGYDADTHYCNYHAQDFELNDKTVSRLKRENAKLSSDELHWHSQAEHYRNMYERM